MNATIRIGTRRSALALAQAESVRRAIQSRHSEADVALVPMMASGDHPDRRGASPDFTDRIDDALVSGEVDLAVHSAKDLPAADRPGLRVAAYPPREDPRDVLLTLPNSRLEQLAPGARVGSSSPRRRAQILHQRPDLCVVEVRGNIETRIRQLRDGNVEALVLAWAGLRRLGRGEEATQVFSLDAMLPAPGQGALAVEVRAGDRRAERFVTPLDDAPTRAAVEAERAFVAALGGDCTVPLAALATIQGAEVTLRGEVYSPDGVEAQRWKDGGPVSTSASVGRRVAEHLSAQGAARLWARAGS